MKNIGRILAVAVLLLAVAALAFALWRSASCEEEYIPLDTDGGEGL